MFTPVALPSICKNAIAVSVPFLDTFHVLAPDGVTTVVLEPGVAVTRDPSKAGDRSMLDVTSRIFIVGGKRLRCMGAHGSSGIMESQGTRLQFTHAPETNRQYLLLV